MRELNELMLEMFVHLHFKPSLLELLNVLFDLNKKFVRCINIVLVVVVDTLVGEFDNFFENVLRSSFSDYSLNWGKDQLDFSVFRVQDRLWLYFGRLMMDNSFDFDGVFLMVGRVSE